MSKKRTIRQGNPHMDPHQKSLDSVAKESPFRTWRKKKIPKIPKIPRRIMEKFSK